MAPWALLPALAAFAGAAAEAWAHRVRLQSIPHRIHVNGTRGKSSVVRLIAAGLREGGLRVVAKTTGSAPRVILPDGEERDLRGRRRPSLREYATVVTLAARLGADALVVECMALRSECQRTAERLMRSTIGVLTDAGLDHLGVMGDTLEEIVCTLGETIPLGGVLVTSGPEPRPAWMRTAAARGAAVYPIVPEPGLSLPSGYFEWTQNVALALAACQAAGVPRERALAGMRRVRPDPGALRVWVRQEPGGGATWYVGAFGANDPVSTRRIVDRVRARPSLHDVAIAGVLNTRADRGERTLQWCEALVAGALPVDRLVITGPHAAAAARLLARRGWGRSRVVARTRAPAEALTALATSGLTHPGPVMIVGMGNVRGAATGLLQHWAAIGSQVADG